MSEAEANGNGLKPTGEQTVEAIREDLACPHCDYNLRGLVGDFVDCPECGQSCDVAALVTARWTGKWYRAPGLNRLLWPTGAAVIGGMVAFMIWVRFEMSDPYTGGNSIWPGAIMIVTLMVWSVLMWRAAGAFMSPGQGVLLALLAHVLFAGYFFGLLGFVSGVVTLVMRLMGETVGFIGPVLIVVAVAVMWGCRRGEKFIAAQCIRRYLQKQSGVDPG